MHHHGQVSAVAFSAIPFIAAAQMIRAILLSISHIDFQYPTEDFLFCREQGEQNLSGYSIANFLILVVKPKEINWDIYPKKSTSLLRMVRTNCKTKLDIASILTSFMIILWEKCQVELYLISECYIVVCVVSSKIRLIIGIQR